ncbi:MAG TPA: DUF1343 domain-containing protein [Candidatus Dormibacteraeota bacterium]|nr:DUF1343 domain-containing protein [Candidatus Dormibacteraeota bacterium]
MAFTVAITILPVVAARTAKTTTAVKTGLDVFEQQHFAPLRGKRVGLITNHTGVDHKGRSVIDLLANAPGVKLAALFNPEHGLFGRADEKVSSITYEVKTKKGPVKVAVHSLYGETRRPLPEMLVGLDALVFDIQDAGVRFYTYTTTMGYAMEEAAKNHIAFYVLDRPNPIGGEVIEGPILDRDRLSFVGYFPMPVRYAMTIGELARMFNTENRIGCDLHIIAMQGWQRSEWYADTGLAWIAPSPNLRTLPATVLYPGLEILQNADVSVGRGTATPFEEFGAPWMRGEEISAEIGRRGIPGLRFSATRYTPENGLHKGELCEGAAIEIVDRNAVRSIRMGLEIADLLQKQYPDNFSVERTLLLLGNAATIQNLKNRMPPADVVASWSTDLAAFQQMRAKYLLY